MEIVFATLIFIVAGLLIISFFSNRERKAVEQYDVAAQTQYYDILERINHLHGSSENNEKLSKISVEIDTYGIRYSKLPATFIRMQRLNKDFKLKSNELLTGGNPLQLATE